MWLLLLYVGLMTGGNQYILHMPFIRAQIYCEGYKLLWLVMMGTARMVLHMIMQDAPHHKEMSWLLGL